MAYYLGHSAFSWCFFGGTCVARQEVSANFARCMMSARYLYVSLFRKYSMHSIVRCLEQVKTTKSFRQAIVEGFIGEAMHILQT